MANNQQHKGPSIVGLPAPQSTPPVFKDSSGNTAIVQLDAAGNVPVAVTGAGSGGTSSVDRAAFAAGTTAGTPAMGAYEASPTTVADGKVGVVGMTTDRAMKVYVTGSAGGGSAVSIADGADVAEGATTDAAVSSDSDGTVNAHARGLVKILADVWVSASHFLKVSIQNATLAVTQSGSWVLSAGSAIIGKVSIDQTTPGTTNGVQTLSGSTTAATQSGTWTVQPGNTANTTAWKVDGSAVTQPVSAAALPLPTGASTAAKQPALGTAGTASTDVLSVQGIASMTPLLVTPAANSAVNLAQVGGTTVVTGGTNGSQGVGGIQAHDAADSGNNPVKVGAKATSSEPAAVSSGDIANLITDLVGKLIVLPYANPENFVSGAITSAMTGTTSTSCVAAPASGLRNYITTIIVSNGSATVPTDILIQDGSGGTTLMTVPAPIGTGTGTGTSGSVIPLAVPLRQPTTATAIYVANVTTGSSTKVSMVGYKGA